MFLHVLVEVRLLLERLGTPGARKRPLPGVAPLVTRHARLVLRSVAAELALEPRQPLRVERCCGREKDRPAWTFRLIPYGARNDSSAGMFSVPSCPRVKSEVPKWQQIMLVKETTRREGCCVAASHGGRELLGGAWRRQR